MRGDVLALIVGWAVLALSIPLFICFLLTIWLDDIETAVFAFGLPTVFCSLVGYWMLKKFTKPDTEERLRDREAFAAVALSWPVAVAIGAMPFWLGGTFNGPFTADAGFAGSRIQVLDTDAITPDSREQTQKTDDSEQRDC